jgi:hypothetical protein
VQAATTQNTTIVSESMESQAAHHHSQKSLTNPLSENDISGTEAEEEVSKRAEQKLKAKAV